MVPIKIKIQFADIHFLTIETLLRHHIQRVINDGGVWKRPRNSPHYRIGLSQKLLALLNSFLSPASTILRDLICISPSDLIQYVEDLNNFHPTYITKTDNDYKILYNIFIDRVYDDSTTFNKYDFINKIDINTCPYCNRNYIYSVNKRKNVKPEIDHFYPKTIYPILAVSYFNLIPSCEPCNGLGAKKQNDPRDVGLINPYLLKISQFRFSLKIKNVSIINPLCGKTDIEVFFKGKVQSHCDIFNLEDLYSLHHDHAIELVIKKRLKYSKNQRAYLNSYNGLKFNKAEIDRMILGNYSLQSEQHKRPLSKLYQDIGKELGLV